LLGNINADVLPSGKGLFDLKKYFEMPLLTK